MRKKIFFSLTVCMLVITMPFMALAHGGRTDGSGGHKDNKNKSGLGGYHYHCGGYPAHLHNGGVCPYKGGGTSSSSSSSSKASVPKTVYASSITAQNVPTQIDAGGTASLEASVYPSNAEDKEITWESSDTSILTVSKTGALTAVGVGTATITAKTSRGTSKSFTITVNEVMAESIAIDEKIDNIIIGEGRTLSATILPDNTTYKNVEWKSDDESIVSIDENGNIKALAVGKTTISATHKELSDSYEIEVKPILAESVTISCINKDTGEEYEELRFEEGQTVALSAAVLPENTTDATLKWSVSNSDVASVDENGTVTALSEGTVIVTAETTNGISDSIEIEVYKTSMIINIIAGIIVFVLCAGVIGGPIVLVKRISGNRRGRSLEKS